MKTFILFITVFLVSVMVSSSPIDHHQDNVISPLEPNARRPSSPAEGGRPGVKGYPPLPERVYPTAVRKGEYVCGNKICKLTPGVEPKGCNGICQYPIL